MKKIAAVLAFSLLATALHAQGGAPTGTAPSAGNVEAQLARYGLTGTWSVNCAAPESTSNSYARYRNRGGKIVQVFSNGTGAENNYEILEVTPISDDKLRVKTRFTNSQADEINDLEWQIRGKQVRTLTNISDKRGPIVQNGVILSVKRDTPWISRCD